MTIHFSFLFRLSPQSFLEGTAHERARSWLPAVTFVSLLPALFAMSSGCCRNNMATIPAIRGRVVEAKTNRPIAGVRLARWFEREDGCFTPGRGDVDAVAGSFLAVVSGNDGSFEWPAWTTLTSPIRTMNWYVYHPDWVAGDGWFEQLQPGLDGYYFGTRTADPWVHLESHPAGFHLEVTVTMEPKQSTTDWEVHFQRLEILTRYGQFEIEYFVKETVAFAEKHELTPAIVEQIYQVQASLGGMENAGSYRKVDQALVLLGIQERYCEKHPEARRCSPEYFAQRKKYLYDRQGPKSKTP